MTTHNHRGGLAVLLIVILTAGCSGSRQRVVSYVPVFNPDTGLIALRLDGTPVMSKRTLSSITGSMIGSKLQEGQVEFFGEQQTTPSGTTTRFRSGTNAKGATSGNPIKDATGLVEAIYTGKAKAVAAQPRPGPAMGIVELLGSVDMNALLRELQRRGIISPPTPGDTVSR